MIVNILLVTGCVLGVVGGAAPTSFKIGPLPFDWTLTIIGAILLISAFFLSRGKKSGGHGGAEPTGKGTVASARDAVFRVAGDVKNLQARAATLAIADLAAQLDEIIKNNIQPVIESQVAVIESQGFETYARHTSPWATGERLIYRAWSAATDGHRPEALASMEESILHFEEAAREWPK